MKVTHMINYFQLNHKVMSQEQRHFSKLCLPLFFLLPQQIRSKKNPVFVSDLPIFRHEAAKNAELDKRPLNHRKIPLISPEESKNKKKYKIERISVEKDDWKEFIK